MHARAVGMPVMPMGRRDEKSERGIKEEAAPPLSDGRRQDQKRQLSSGWGWGWGWAALEAAPQMERAHEKMQLQPPAELLAPARVPENLQLLVPRLVSPSEQGAEWKTQLSASRLYTHTHLLPPLAQDPIQSAMPAEYPMLHWQPASRPEPCHRVAVGEAARNSQQRATRTHEAAEG